jgi:phospholipid/cholesterol/gamma-HCH transport system permease protein
VERTETMDFVHSGSQYAKNLVVLVGDFYLFTVSSIKLWFRPPYRIGEMIKHLEFTGNKSISIIVLTGTFTGMVFSYQVYQGFVLVNAVNLVGSTVALGISRELSPVLTGLIVAARAGGAMAARLGTMRVTEQIDALEVMGVNPKQYLISPRIVASVIAVPMLTAIFSFVALIGSYFVSVRLLGIDEAIFFHKLQYYVDPEDFYQGIVKGAFFGFIFSTVCCFRGFYTTGGAKGVGDATNQGVVVSMILIIVVDYFLTNFIIGIIGVR